MERNSRVGPLTRIRYTLRSLDGVFLKIAESLLKDGEALEAKTLTTGGLAARLDTSRASIVRFTQHIGYSGFPDFKAALLQEVAGFDTPETNRELPEAATRVATMTQQSVVETLSSLDATAFNKAVEAICQAPSLFWFGVGDGGLVARIGAYKFTRAGRRAQAISDLESILSVAATADENDVLIVVSQSGRWLKAAEAFLSFQRRKAVVIAITSQPNSVVAKASDIVLLTACRDVTVGVGAFTFRAPEEMLINMLVMDSASRLENVSLSWIPPTPTRK